MQLSLLDFAARDDAPARRTWDDFAAANPQALEALARLTREAIARGAKYLTAKGLFEDLRRDPRFRTDKPNGYKLDNCYTADAARYLAARIPEAASLFRFRRRRGEP